MKLSQLSKSANKYNSTLSIEELKNRFKGCLVGALIGDCYGKPYKLSENVSKQQLQKYFDKLAGPYFNAPYKPYSSITGFSNCLAKSLLECNQFNATDVAKKFTKHFFDDPHRDYGENIPQILAKMRGSKFADPYAPALECYLGLGSYGNAGAARIAPVVLHSIKNEEEMTDIASKSASLTNAHQFGRNGAILHSYAIKTALELGPHLSVTEYLETLKGKIKTFEIDEEGLSLNGINKFEQQLIIVTCLLEQKNPSEEQVVDMLGHGRVAVYSVPTAIYCFLRGRGKIPEIETDATFTRIVQYAIALGGDTDSIASMAGAIAGACYGFDSIGESLIKHCEGYQQVIKLAEDIFESNSNRLL